MNPNGEEYDVVKDSGDEESPENLKNASISIEKPKQLWGWSWLLKLWRDGICFLVIELYLNGVCYFINLALLVFFGAVF